MSGQEQSHIRGLAVELHDWIGSGATQHKSGAVAGWITPSGQLSEPYMEITGYYLTYSCWARTVGLTSLRSGAHSAAKAADWLAVKLHSRDFSGRPIADGSRHYTFDLAMAATGLFNWSEFENSAWHRAAAQIAVDRILEIWGQLPPSFARGTGATNEVIPERLDKWSLRGAAHLLKVVQCLLMAEGLGDARAGSWADKLAAEGLRQISIGGGNEPLRTSLDGPVSLHALAYAAEGLWLWGSQRSHHGSLRASRALTRWLSRWRVGSLTPGFVIGDEVVGLPQADASAQTLRLESLHGLMGTEIVELATGFGELTVLGEYGRAMKYQPTIEASDRNIWASMFLVQALSAVDGGTLGWKMLV